VNNKFKAGAIIALAFLIFVASSGCTTQEKAKADSIIPTSNLTLTSMCTINATNNYNTNGYIATYHDNDNNNTIYVAIGADNLVTGIAAVKGD
jgi:hypothetical protein